jgi:hypothetical protein
MKHYALLFRASRTLTPEELKQRTIDIQLWVKRVTEMGITLDPRSLGEGATRFSTEGGTVVVSHAGPIDPALTNIVFFDSASSDQAMEIARIHPGLHYGVSVELRDWSSPRPAVARP